MSSDILKPVVVNLRMKCLAALLFTFILILVECTIYTQEHSSWTLFSNDDSTLMGFKDQNGKIRIEPKYTAGFNSVRKFDKIVALMEPINGKQTSFYLTKSGKIVGRDSLYMCDNVPDCESEGFIRFHDRKTDKVGMYNGEGEIVIPAEYSDLTNVRNGLVAALKGAEKEYPDGHEESGCHHFSWAGGKEYLIDINNKIIIENFAFLRKQTLNFYSIEIDNEPIQDADRKTFLGTDGRYYSFIDYEKEFQSWLNFEILQSLSKEKLIENSYKEIYTWDEQNGWKSEVSRVLIERNYALIKSRLAVSNKKKEDSLIYMEGLNPLIFEAAEFEAYFNNFGDSKEWEYPVMTYYPNRRNINQDTFGFLRTKSGYKLIMMVIRSN